MLTSHREEPDLTNGRYRLRLEVGSRQWGGGAYDIDLTIQPALGQVQWKVASASLTAPTSSSDPLIEVKLDMERIGSQAKKPLTRGDWINRSKKRQQLARSAFDELVDEGIIVPVGTIKRGTQTLDTFKMTP